MQTARRLYLYLLAGIGLGILVSGVSLLLTTLFQAAGLSGGQVLSGEDAVRERLTLATAMTVVSLPVWLIHWFVAERAVRPGRGEAELERNSAVRGLFFALVLGALLVAMLVSATALIEFAVLAVAGGPPEFLDPAGSLGLLIAAGGAWGYHLRVRIRDWSRGSLTGGGAWLPRTYLYLAAFFGFFVLLFGIADLAGLAGRLVADAAEPTLVSGRPWWSDALASALGRIIAGAATWLGHWWYAQRLWADPAPRAALERRSRLRYAFFAAVLVVAAAAAIGYLGQALSGILDAAFGTLDAGQLVVGELIGELLSALLFAAAWWLHAAWLRRAVAGPDGLGVAAGERLVAYPTAIVGLVFGAVALGRLVGLLIEVLAGGARVLAGGEATVELLADLLPYTVLGTVVWLWQWGAVLRARAADPVAEGASTVRRGSLLVVLAAAILASVAALGVLLYQLFGTIFGIDLQGPLVARIAAPLGAMLVGSAVAAYHGQLLRTDGRPRAIDEAAGAADEARVRVELPLVLIGPPGADAAAVGRARLAIEQQLPEGFTLRDDDRRMS